MIFIKKREEKFKNHMEYATSLLSKSNFEEAILEFEKALKVKSNSSEAWRMLGDCYDTLAGTKIFEEKWDEVGTLKNKAISCLQESIKIDPSSAETYAMLGNVLWGMDFRKSLIEFEKALSLEPSNKVYKDSVDQLKPLIKEGTYTLDDFKVFLLKSAREEPHPNIFKEKFYWQHTKISSAVIYDCHSGTETQKTVAWLFESEESDLTKERPVAQLYFIFDFIRSNMPCKVNVESGCPFNYEAIVQRLIKEGLI